MIPGSNLLDDASSLIDFVPIPYYAHDSRTLNDVGIWIATFLPPYDLYASVQQVPRSKYVYLGLELQRQYVKVYASADLFDLQRDYSGDQFIWGGKIFQVESQNTWFIQDGWASCLAVQISNDSVLPLLATSP